MFEVEMKSQLKKALLAMEMNVAEILDKSASGLLPADNLFSDVRRQFRKLGLKYHPDTNKEPGAKKKFQEIVDVYEWLAEAFHDKTLHRLLSPTPSYFPESPLASPDFSVSANSTEANIFVSDSTKNALFAYYKAQFPMKFVEISTGVGFEVLGQILSEILGVSAMAFNVRPNSSNCGYEIFNCSFSKKLVIEDFISSIGNDYVEELKRISFQYSLPFDAGSKALQIKTITDPDQISIRVKNLIGLTNTSKIYTECDESTKQYCIFISSGVEEDLRKKIVEKLKLSVVRTPLQFASGAAGAEHEAALTVPASNEVALSGLKIQVVFSLDATGSMSSMLEAAKKGLQTAGTAIQTANKDVEPEMCTVTYFDYCDHGQPLSHYTYGGGDGGGYRGYRGAGKAEVRRFTRGEAEVSRFTRGEAEVSRFTRGEAEVSRFTRGEAEVSGFARGGDRVPSGVALTTDNSGSSALATSPTEGVLQALNYPGKRESDKLPAFTSPLIVSNMLQAVKTGGGGDIPEMVEAALAVITQLRWDAPVQTMYMAFDAPPHVHYTGVCGDNQGTLDAVKAEQSKLKESDPCLSRAISPEDWVTQAIILSRKGVVINPMICSNSIEVVFFATFMAHLSGGMAVFLDNSSWNDQLESYIEKNTQLDIEEIGYELGSQKFNGVQERREQLVKARKLKRPSHQVEQAIKALMSKIESVVYDPKLCVKKAACTVRKDYEQALRPMMRASLSFTVEDVESRSEVVTDRAGAIERRRGVATSRPAISSAEEVKIHELKSAAASEGATTTAAAAAVGTRPVASPDAVCVGIFSTPKVDKDLNKLVLDGLSKISANYQDGPHKSKLHGLIDACENHSEKDQFLHEIGKLTKWGGGLGNGKLNAALCELSRQVSEGRVDGEYLGRLAGDKHARRTLPSSALTR